MTVGVEEELRNLRREVQALHLALDAFAIALLASQPGNGGSYHASIRMLRNAASARQTKEGA